MSAENSSLNEDVINIINEDLYQKTLKGLIRSAIQYQKHCRRVKLTAADIEAASDSFLFGEENDESAITKNIDLEFYIDQKWEELPDISYSTWCLSCPESMLSEEYTLDQNLKDYFSVIIKSLFTKNPEQHQFSLKDLKESSSVLPLLPVFLDYFCNDYTLMKHKAAYLSRILFLLHSLFINPHLYFRNQDIYKLINFVLSVVTSNIPAMSSKKSDCCCLQNNAAKFLYQIILKTESKFLFDFSLKKLQAPLELSEIKLQQCYGALVALIELQLPAVARVIPRVFFNFSQKLKKKMSDNNFSQKQLDNKCYEDHNQNMADAVHIKLLDACELLLKHYIHEAMHSSQIRLAHCCTFSKISNSYICEEVGNESVIFKICKNILEYFGNMLTSRLPSLKDKLNGEQSLLDFFTNATVMPEEEISKNN